MSTNSALFTSCCTQYDPDLLIKDILDVEILPTSNKEIEDIVSYNWKIDTKYYTADIKLCTTRKRTVGTAEFAESVQAAVIYFNASQPESFDLAKAWLPYLEEISPAIQLLVCRNIPQSQATHRHNIQKWCLDNDFELVELEPEVKQDEDDDFQETTGIKRIIQALHAHMWPDMVLKENQHTVSPYMRKLMEEESLSKKKQDLVDPSKGDDSSLKTERVKDGSLESGQCEKETNGQLEEKTHLKAGKSAHENPEKTHPTAGKSAHGDPDKEKAATHSTTKDNKLLEDLIPDNDNAFMESLCSEEEEAESFEQLFSKFRLMKEKAESLPQEEKKKYAEKVTLAFWKAIGGDEEEIGDLSDLSDTEMP
ncbi:alpha- and gamma-adaptin-binding protein p34-like [Saccostrea echinata]|uniref:alpha- and gamma-adaptin-binding protein p34-like n=1 Tax=Saccostrea echinata TaxID=191078 RepID=UPI002A7EC859|nr:alpha- and gamma-adaptin-binding protein p34-like [Saccostrea echinata]